MAQRANPEDYWSIAQGVPVTPQYYPPPPPLPQVDNSQLIILALVLGVGLLAFFAYLSTRK